MLRFLLFLCGVAFSFAAPTSKSTKCKAFTLPSNLTSQNVAITFSTYYPAGALVNLTNLYESIDTATLPAFCRLELKAYTNITSGNYANLEIWLPDSWNGRSLGLGTGGSAGGNDLGNLGFAAVAQGFAGFSSNMGHNSTTVDYSFGLDPQATIDFGHRALDQMVNVSRPIIAAFYDKPASKHYYLGCSTGGRQGLTVIQNYPDHFNGIVIGSPANDWSNLTAWSVRVHLNVLPTGSPQWIPVTTWTNVIYPEVLNQCDGIDGLKDGIINNPRKCIFRPETLVCRPGQNATTCLNLDQLHALKQIYTPWVDTNQTYVYSGYEVGGEQNYGLYYDSAADPGASAGGVSYYQSMVYNSTTWDYHTDLTLASVELSNQINPGNINAFNPDLRPYAEAPHNGKVLQYVGWADPLIPPGGSIDWFNKMSAFMTSNSTLTISDFYRLFTVPGMDHCSGGYGPTGFGGSTQASSGMPPLKNVYEHNALLAMVRWVEEGLPPEQLIGAYYNDQNSAMGLNFTMPLCPYPATPKYSGSGDTKVAASFYCE